MKTIEKQFDVVVIGAGYGGSILSLILAKSGLKVLLVDRSKHPRFTIGESSTPIADALLADLAERYAIPELKILASFGSWQKHFPAVRCGLKRGFSYFAHRKSQPLSETADHRDSLLVAASVNDDLSDTHWVRSDVDLFLSDLAESNGVVLLEQTSIHSLQRIASRWDFGLQLENSVLNINADWIVDATGNSALGRMLLNAGCGDARLETKARCIYGHFFNVDSVTKGFESNNYTSHDWNFNPDDAAQHHVLEFGWLWMLRFKNDLTSVGLMTRDFTTSLKDQWDSMLRSYPSIAVMLEGASLVDSTTIQLKPKSTLERIDQQVARCNTHAFRDGWVALPNAFGFVDPLHSSGIAHNLTGVRRLAEILLGSDKVRRVGLLYEYEQKLKAEIEWIDGLVSLCYAGLPNTKLFMSFSAAYFMAVLAQESSLSQEIVSDDFLSASNHALRSSIQQFYCRVKRLSNDAKQEDELKILDEFRKIIEPWNRVGLLSDISRNRIEHTAVPKWFNCE